ncbi:MAG: phosphatidate cytidylyltransferase [Proteobacteria bacterium]|nr:phosphatidate cytidylyltransferase [Pseudomonadota bacterium]
MSPLAQRVATAAVLLPAALAAIILLPTQWFALVAIVVVLLAAPEWETLARFTRPQALRFKGALGTAVIGLWMLLTLAPPTRVDVAITTLLVVASAFWLGVALPWVVRRWTGIGPWRTGLAGVVVFAGFVAALVDLHARSPWTLLATMAVVWIADTAAYFSGRAFGRHKLAPLVSPGKTSEGVAGAVVAVVVYVAILAVVTPGFARGAGAATLAGWLIGAVALTMISVLGDLYESWLKRVAGVKDSGRVLPGHGGILDRIDALLAALPLAALAMRVFSA